MKKAKFSNKQLRQLIRPMFSSTISFGYATPEQVENTLDDMFGVDSREIKKEVCKLKCQKNRACVKQSPNSLPDTRKKCTGCDKIGKDKK